MSKRIDAATVEAVIGSLYPPPFDQPCQNRERRRLGDAAGLQQFGVNLLRLPPGSWSSQRHWHTHEDEFVYVLAGEVTLVGDAGTELELTDLWTQVVVLLWRQQPEKLARMDKDNANIAGDLVIFICLIELSCRELEQLNALTIDHSAQYRFCVHAREGA